MPRQLGSVPLLKLTMHISRFSVAAPAANLEDGISNSEVFYIYDTSSLSVLRGEITSDFVMLFFASS